MNNSFVWWNFAKWLLPKGGLALRTVLLTSFACPGVWEFKGASDFKTFRPGGTDSEALRQGEARKDSPKGVKT
jgi:hypothetical protein